jgi:hypothetical protein
MDELELANVPTLNDLQNSETFGCRRGVPVFRPHTRYVLGRDGRPNFDKIKYVVTEDDLPEVCRNSNEQVERDCHFPRQTIGHVLLRPDAVEHEQPAKLIGHVVNYRVGRMPNGDKVVLADLYTRNSLAEEADKFPYRSAEYNWRTKRIGGVARLLKDPALGLGTMEAYESHQSFTCYAEAVMDENDPKEPKTPEAKPDKNADEQQKPPVPPKQESDLNPDEAVVADRFWSYFACKYPAVAALAASVASGTNTGMPEGDQRPSPPEDEDGEKAKLEPRPDEEFEDDDDGEGLPPKKKKAKTPDEDGDVSKNAAPTVDVEAYAALQGEVETLRKDNKDLREAQAKRDVAAIVTGLVEVEHYELDTDDQAILTAELLPMDDAGRKKKADFVRKTCKQKAGYEGTIQVLEGNSGVTQAVGDNKAMDADHYNRASAMCRTGVDWATAVQKTKKA